MIKINKKTSKKITFLLFFTLFLTGLFTFKDYGISIDEEFHRSSGFYWLNYILNFTSFDDFKNLVSIKINQIHGFTLPLPETYPYYGVVFDLPIAFLEVLFQINDPKNYFYFKHLLNFILFFISSVFFYKLLLNRFINYNIALIGTLFFILSPRIYGNSFFNNKDLVFLSLVTITLYYCFKSLDKLSYKNLLIFSTLAALCTAHRVLGFFIPISFFIFFLLSVLSNTKNLKNLPNITFFFIFYFLFLILFWPLLWVDPFENFSLLLLDTIRYNIKEHPNNSNTFSIIYLIEIKSSISMLIKSGQLQHHPFALLLMTIILLKEVFLLSIGILTLLDLHDQHQMLSLILP